LRLASKEERLTMARTYFIWAIVPAVLASAAAPHGPAWAPLRYFVGAWEGAVTSRASIGTATREFRFVMDGAFLEERGTTVYEMSTQLPEGQTREDLGFFSYDQARGGIVLREFHPEGYVAHYVLDSLSADTTTIVFVSDTIENMPAGWRTKVQYEILGKDEFIELFKLAPPGQVFEVYWETHFTRKDE
jgi:hypothetical protein